jgi:hypothetical protein
MFEKSICKAPSRCKSGSGRSFKWLTKRHSFWSFCKILVLVTDSTKQFKWPSWLTNETSKLFYFVKLCIILLSFLIKNLNFQFGSFVDIFEQTQTSLTCYKRLRMHSKWKRRGFTASHFLYHTSSVFSFIYIWTYICISFLTIDHLFEILNLPCMQRNNYI